MVFINWDKYFAKQNTKQAERIKELEDKNENLKSWNKKQYDKIEKYEQRIKELEKIADLAYDIHTRDPINIREKWGVWRVPAEKLLCEMIESLKDK